MQLCSNYYPINDHCYSIVELETTWKKETCIHVVELGNFIFFPIGFRIVLYINRLFVINEKIEFFLQLSLITRYQSFRLKISEETKDYKDDIPSL